MNSPHRVHPALPLEQRDNTIEFKTAATKVQTALSPPLGPSRLEQLVSLEADIRQQPKRSVLSFHAVNEPRGLVGFEQAFLFRLNRNGKPNISNSSSVARVEMLAPLISAIVADVASLAAFEKPASLHLKIAQRTEDYPFAQGFWSPFIDTKGKCFGGLLFVKSKPFTDADGLIATRIGQTYGHAFRALSPPALLRAISVPRWLMIAVPLVLVGLFFIPVPMTSLAPFEIVADEPIIVTAPIDGAISDVVSSPNSAVKKGDVLFHFDATILQAEAEIARQRSLVAETKLATAKNSAFSDGDAKRALAELQTEVDLTHAERDYALSLLERTVVMAQGDGLLVYSSKSDWIGKPVRVGEKIMEIAAPDRVEYRADLAVHDAISLNAGARVKLFLDADPLTPRLGEVAEMSYHASEKPGGQLAYTIRIRPTGGGSADRIGLRGTAQISGEDVSLGFYLFRRPIAAVRQYFGL